MFFLITAHRIFLLFISVDLCSLCDGNTSSRRYTNTWAVHIPHADQEKANRIARRHGMINLGQIGVLDGFYHFRHRAYPRRMRRETVAHTSRLSREFEVKWVEQQVAKRRAKRSANFNDPLWLKQWYLRNMVPMYLNYDHNVVSVWTSLNVIGRGVSVSILDDGIEKDHPDLAKNYDPEASFDFNSHDPDPSPRPTYNDENRHGTRCAGEVAALAGNGVCGVGVAYGAKVGGIRMLDGDVTDAVEAHSLSYKPQHIDIYSSSWGPDDDGKTVDGPGPLAKLAFSEGILKGRGGLGNIFVWASGNGGREQDNCNCDGYTNSIYTLSISSATEHGTSPWYSEYCASTLASTFSSGSFGMRKIVTTDLHHRCTESHTGTSASAPLAAGILALALEANPKLTWRDTQHVVVRASTPDRLVSNDWVVNGVGRKVSHRFGYGLLNAHALVDLAKRWKSVPEQHHCSEPVDTSAREIPHTGSLTIEKTTTGCEGTKNYIRYLEHVEVMLSLSFTRRGDLAIFITSPQGTRSTLLAKRRNDYSSKGFNKWVFMSTHSWEENPKGKWKLEIQNVGSPSNTGSLTSWQLRFYGTADAPDAGYTNCSSECVGGCRGPSAKNCLHCANYRSDSACVKECPAKQYADENTKKCLPCSEFCEKCQGPNPNQCTACILPRLLKEGVCVAHCPEGWFKTEDNRCVRCDSKCRTCAGKTEFCTSCKEDHTLQLNRCIINCKANEYVKQDLCWPCHPSCAKCNNGTAWSCTACEVTMSTREGVEHNLYLHRGMCVITCPSGFYGNNHQCEPCDASCKHCEGPLKTECTSCKAGLVRMSNGTTSLCLDRCPRGFSHGISEDLCVKCGPDCSACDPDHPSNCTGCDHDMFLWRRKCVRAGECPRGTYPEFASHSCPSCHPSCDTCVDSPTYCTSCSGYLYLHGNTCVSKCPLGTYGRENKCLPCHSNCSSCFGGGQHKCLSCKHGSYSFNNSCVKECPQEMFVEEASKRCQPCSLSCDGCIGQSTNCTRCKGGLKNVDGVCKSECEDGRFYNSTLALQDSGNNTESHCLECHPSCSSCFGASKYDCLRCIGVKFLDTRHKLCSLDCPRGFYDDFASTLCRRCPFECLACSNQTTCSKCVPGLVLHDTKCLPYCPEGFYADGTTSTCMPCDASCKECAGSPSSCISCNEGRIPFNNECLGTCPFGTFLSRAFNRCLSCDESCSTCVGPGRHHCTSCAESLVLFQAQCRSSCPSGYYFNKEAKLCLSCGYYCRRCEGGSGLTNCAECSPPFALENHVCVRSCSPGYVLDRGNGACVPCHHSCSTCVGPRPDECLSCKESDASLENSVCKKTCTPGMYRDPETARCERCHPLCKTCSGSGETACTSCIPGYYRAHGHCVSACVDGQYRKNGLCYMCDKACGKCKGPSKEDCLSCNGEGKLYRNACERNCLPGSYETVSNGLKECGSCHPSCATCVGEGTHACTSCRINLVLEETSCVSQCSLNYRLDENTRICKKCEPRCFSFANLTDRSADEPLPRGDAPSSKGAKYFIPIAFGTCSLLLVMFALMSLVKIRSSNGYRRVSDSHAGIERRGSLDGTPPYVLIRDNYLETDEEHDSEL